MKRVALLAVIALAACSKTPEPQPVAQQQVPQQQVYQQPMQQAQPMPAPVQYVQQPAPVVVQQESGIGNLATGMLLGHMLSGGGGGGGGSSNNVTRNTTVVNKTVVNKTYVQQAPKPTAVSRPAPSATRRK